MQYAKAGDRLISIGLVNFGAPFKELHRQTDVGIYELFSFEGHEDFRNTLSVVNQNRFDERGYWAEITADMIAKDSAGETKGMLPVTCIANAGTEMEKVYKRKAPKPGYYVPTDECEKVNGILVPFQPGTGIPFRTTEDREEAMREWEKHGLNPYYVSFFNRPDNYKAGDRFVGRCFGPDFGGSGRFGVDTRRLPSCSGNDGVASRPKYDGHPNPEIVMEI